MEANFLYLKHSDWPWDPYSLHWVAHALSPAIRQLGHETDHYPISIAKLKNEQKFYSHSLYIFMVCTSTASPSSQNARAVRASSF
jgi:hypothetical protein